jgi:YgiT-type zinc finger domain-containing protein
MWTRPFSGEKRAMLATLSKCLRCGSTEIENRTVEEFVRRGRYVAALRVPANVCANCGEQYFERAQVAAFEDVRYRLERGALEGFRVTGEVLEPVAHR